MFVVRLIIGGLLVAGIPELAKRAGTRWAGILLVIPVITLASLFFIGTNMGVKSAVATAWSSLWGLVPAAVFILAFIAAASHYRLIYALAVAAMFWGISSAILHILLSKLSNS